MTDDTPAAIAAELSEAQKRALLWLPESGTYTRLQCAGIYALQTSLKALMRRGLAHFFSTRFGWGTTTLGAQVRAVLAGEKP